MSNIKNFKPFKPPGNIPIIGQQPDNVRDALNRILQVGDLVALQTVTAQPFRLTKIEPAQGEPNGLQVHFEAHAVFLAPKNGANAEFLRIASIDEMRKPGVPVEPEKAQEIADAVEEAEAGDKTAPSEPSSE